MIKTFTQDDLIRFFYHETTEEENREIKRALKYDPDLTLQFEAIEAAARSLDSALVEPSNATIQRILDYSKGL